MSLYIDLGVSLAQWLGTSTSRCEWRLFLHALSAYKAGKGDHAEQGVALDSSAYVKHHRQNPTVAIRITSPRLNRSTLGY